jgi:transcriptional regulator with XRE-family HTH domain
MTLTETIRRAIRDSGLSLYAIGRDAGVKRQSLERFMAGKQSLRLDMADKLAEFLGIECRCVKRRKGRTQHL